MFKDIARTLLSTSLASTARSAIAQPSLAAPAEQDIDLTFTGRGKGGKHSSKPSGAAQLKRAAKKANNIRKFG